MDLADPNQWNAYAYSHNNPVTFSDPSGLKTDWDEEKRYGNAAPVLSQKPLARPPKVSNPRLQAVLDKLYSAYHAGVTTWVGDGTATDALLNELRTGLKTQGVFHHKDVVDLAAELSELIEGDFRASSKLESGHSMRQFELITFCLLMTPGWPTQSSRRCGKR